MGSPPGLLAEEDIVCCLWTSIKIAGLKRHTSRVPVNWKLGMDWFLTTCKVGFYVKIPSPFVYQDFHEKSGLLSDG